MAKHWNHKNGIITGGPNYWELDSDSATRQEIFSTCGQIVDRLNDYEKTQTQLEKDKVELIKLFTNAKVRHGKELDELRREINRLKLANNSHMNL